MDFILHRLPIKQDVKLCFMDTKPWNLIFIKKISKTAIELEIYIAVEQKINEVEILKYSFLHFLLFLDLVCNLLPDNFVTYLFTFSSILYDFHFKNGRG